MARLHGQLVKKGFEVMPDSLIKTSLKDNGGRRLTGERRRISYTLHVPERRNGIDRRSGKDRRRFPRLG